MISVSYDWIFFCIAMFACFNRGRHCIMAHIDGTHVNQGSGCPMLLGQFADESSDVVSV